jgi:acetyl esterase/lipase
MALTLDVFTPQRNANGIGIIWLVSGGWVSSHEFITFGISLLMINTLVRRGYTVFAVVPSSQPKFTIPEMVKDVQHATRFVRYHAADYNIAADRIGITGASSGGQLALMQAMDGDNGDPLAKDPVERVSSHVQATACFFPPTDFMNYGHSGADALGQGLLKGFAAPFAFSPKDPAKRREIGRQISPINYVSADDPPTLIIHGDKDPLVPIQQAKTMIAKLKKEGVVARLIIKPGGGHGWPGLSRDMPKIADWFDKYLLKNED